MYNQGRGTGPFGGQHHHPSQTHNQRYSTASTGPFGQPSTHYSTTLRPPPFLPPLVNPYAPEQFSNIRTNAEGYTLSSTYIPASGSESQFQPRTTPALRFTPSFGGGGNIPCTRQGCSYMGRSNKDVELHMMDRHFIYPPGWNERKRRRDDGAGPDGDASASILIQQFKIQLDTPEAIQKWIADRKKKWPSSQRIEEKSRSTEEARARGELFFPAERPTRDTMLGRGGPRGRDRGGPRARGRGRGRGRGIHQSVVLPHDGEGKPRNDEDCETRHSHPTRGRAVDRGWGARGRGGLPARPADPLLTSPSSTSSDESDSSHSGSEDEDSDSGSDMDPVKDAISSRPPPNQNAEVNSPSSRSFIQQSTVMAKGNESDDDAMAVDEALGNLASDSEAEAEAGVEVGSRDIADGVAQQPTPLSDHISPPSTIQPSASKPQEAVTKRSRPRHRVPAPPRTRQNPFSLTRPTRPSLLKNLLAHDVQVTISNLSQAVRFLVANDCLEGVELKPGEAEEREARRKIVVVSNEDEMVSAESAEPAVKTQTESGGQ